ENGRGVAGAHITLDRGFFLVSLARLPERGTLGGERELVDRRFLVGQRLVDARDLFGEKRVFLFPLDRRKTLVIRVLEALEGGKEVAHRALQFMIRIDRLVFHVVTAPYADRIFAASRTCAANARMDCSFWKPAARRSSPMRMRRAFGAIGKVTIDTSQSSASDMRRAPFDFAAFTVRKPIDSPSMISARASSATSRAMRVARRIS